jgi:hypothetical protein
MQPGTNIADYVNTYEQLRLVLPKLSVTGVSAASPAVQYWFREYFDYINTIPHQDPAFRFETYYHRYESNLQYFGSIKSRTTNILSQQVFLQFLLSPRPHTGIQFQNIVPCH